MCVYVCEYLISYSPLFKSSTCQDNYRDIEIFKQLYQLEVLVLYSKSKVVPIRGSTKDRFKEFLKDKLELKLHAINKKYELITMIYCKSICLGYYDIVYALGA